MADKPAKKLAKKPSRPRSYGARLPAAQQHKRDLALVRLRLLHPSWTWQQLADRLKEIDSKWALGWEACRKIIRTREAEAVTELSKQDKIEAISEHIQGFRDLREQAAEVIDMLIGGAVTVKDETTGKPVQLIVPPSPTAILKAIKLILDLRKEEISLEQAAGLLPRDLGRLALEIDFNRVKDIFLDVLDQWIPPKQQPEVERMLMARLDNVKTDADFELEPVAED